MACDMKGQVVEEIDMRFPVDCIESRSTPIGALGVVPIFSVITAVRDGGDAYLPEAYESVAGQRLPKGWSLQWLVQEDGKTGKPLDRLPDKPWISKDVGQTGGSAQTRTLALQHAEGMLTRTLDADDLFPDSATLARDIEALAANPDLGWTVAPGLELHSNGRLVPAPHDLLPGRLSPGHLAASLRTGSMPLTGATATIYTELVVAHGGWPAISSCEDVGPLLAAEAVVDGWVQEKPGVILRRRSTPPATGPEHRHKHERERGVHIGVVLGRADAIRELGWRWQPSEPVTI